MTKYVLKDDAPTGIYDEIGEVRHGQIITPAYPAQEEMLKSDTRFKQYRAAAEGSDPVTTGAKVEDAEADAAPAKPAKKAKE